MKMVNRHGKLLAVFAIIAVAVFAYSASAAASCGNGQCENVIPMVFCEGENCPIPESYENCPQDCPASCSDGFKNQDETGVDCGGSCTLNTVLEVCDGKDNNRDCLVDVDCKTNTGKVVSGVAPSKGTPAPCYNGLQDSGEEGVDCGGTCFKDWVIEECDGKDNDKDCQVDEGGVCNAKTNVQEEISQPTVTPTSAPGPDAVPEPTSAPEAVSASVAPIGESTAEPNGGQVQPSAIPAGESPSSQPALADGYSGLSQGDVVLQASQIRQFAKKNSIHIPESEPDSELLRKYTEFGKKHEAELEAKFQGKELTENDVAAVLRQFSEETYPKPEPKPQSQSFFSKVRSFFKKLFGG